MAVLKKALGKISTWRKVLRPSTSTPAEDIEYDFEVQVGLKSRMKHVLDKSAAIEGQTHQLLLPSSKVLEPVCTAAVVAGHSLGVIVEPQVDHTLEAGERGKPDTAVSKVIESSHVNDFPEEPLDAVPATDGAASKEIESPHVKDFPEEPFDAVPATDGILAMQGEETTPFVILDAGSTTLFSPDQTNAQGCGQRENKNDAGQAQNHSATKTVLRVPTPENNTHSMPDLEVPSTLDDMRAGRFAGSTESSSRVTDGEARNPTEITTPSLHRAVATPDMNLALVPYKPFPWGSLLSGSHVVPDAEKACDTNLITSSGTTVIAQPPQVCNCEEKHAAELEDLRGDLKEEYEIELEVQMEKLQEKHDEKIKKLQSELDRVASSRKYVKSLGKKKLDTAMDAKTKLEQTLHNVERILKAKDAVIEVAEAYAAQLEETNNALAVKIEEKIRGHGAALAEIQVALTRYVEQQDAHVKRLMDEWSHTRASSVEADERGANEQYWIDYFAHRPINAALAYVNAKKELTLAEKHTVDLEAQLHSFNSEFDQDPARLAGVTRLLEFKDGHILELQKAIGEYHDALKQSQANSVRDQEHAKADVKLREAELELLQKEKADIQTRLEETRQGWENVAQMFGRQVFGDDIANSMNELYEVVKQDNAFLCGTVEGQASRIVHLMREGKNLKAKVLDLEKAVKDSESTRGEYEEDARAAKHATETAKIETDIRVDDLTKQIMSRDATITTLNKDVETLRGIVDASVNPSRASAELMKQKDTEIASLAQELEVVSTRKLELEQMSEYYEDLQSWKNNIDKEATQQEFTTRGLREKVVQLEERLRAALVASDSGKFEAAQTMIQQIGEMFELWCSMRTECDRSKRQAGHDNEMLGNERVYFAASIQAAREILMVVWGRYEMLWYGLRNEGIILDQDPTGPQEISDQVAQIFQDDDAQRAGINAIAEKCKTAATEGLSSSSVQQPKAENLRHADQIIDAAQLFLEQIKRIGGPAEPDQHSSS
ncbi:MAG: hypothetical protein Q9223_002681 [Gallowayella weberi]